MPESPRVLVIDDDPEAADFLAVAVRAMGFPADVIRDGQAALDAALDAKAPVPGLVILDALLPKVDGYQVLAAWKTAHPDVPVAVISGIYKKRQYQQEALRLGASEFLAKPLSVLQVWELVSRHVGEAPPEILLDGLQGLRFARRPLAQVAAELHHACATGLLFVRSGEGSAVLFLEDGRIVFARSSDPSARLDAVVAETCGLDPKTVGRLGEIVATNRGRVRLGELLVGDKLITQDQLDAALREQQRRNVARPFTWPQSASTFFATEAPRSETFKLPVDVPALVLWGARHLPAGEGLHRSVAPESRPRMVHRLAEDTNRFHLSKDELAFLRLVDGSRELRNLRAIGRLAQVDADRLLIGLSWLGMIEVPATDPVERPRAAEIAVAGDLRRTPPGRLLVNMHLARRTGALRFEAEGGQAVRIAYLDEGLLAYASSSDPDDRLGQVLVRSGFLTPQELQQALDVASRNPGQYLGHVLVALGLLSFDDLHRALVAQVTQVVRGFVGLPAGAFTFDEGPLPQREIVPLSLDTLEVVVNAARSQSPAEVAERRPAAFTHLRATSMALELVSDLSLTPLEERVLRVLDGTRACGDLAEALEEDGELVARSLDTLLLLGLAEALPERQVPRPATAGGIGARANGPCVALDAAEILGEFSDEDFAHLAADPAAGAKGFACNAGGTGNPGMVVGEAESFDDDGEAEEPEAECGFFEGGLSTPAPRPEAARDLAPASAVQAAVLVRPEQAPVAAGPECEEPQLDALDLAPVSEFLRRVSLHVALDPGSLPEGVRAALPEELRRRFGI